MADFLLPWLVKEASQSLPSSAANKVEIIFRRGVYLAKILLTLQVWILSPLWTKYARSSLQKFLKKVQRTFLNVKRSVQTHAPFGFF